MEMRTKTAWFFALIALFLLDPLGAEAQRARGELHIEARDPQGAVLAPFGELTSEVNQFRRTFVLGSNGSCVLQDLPFGLYQLKLQAKGFAPWTGVFAIRSELPVHVIADTI